MNTMAPDLDGVNEMAGVVKAQAYYSADVDAVEVVPDHCPCMDVHRKAAERQYAAELAAWQEAHGLPSAELVRPAVTRVKCTTVDNFGARRWCRYYYGFALASDETRRVDVSMLRDLAVVGSGRGVKIITLCAGAQRNRPPGV